MGHLSWKTLYYIADAEAVDGLPASNKEIKTFSNTVKGQHMLTNMTPCEACAMGKAHRNKFKSTLTRPSASHPLHTVSADLAGPVEVEGNEDIIDVIGTQKYVSVILDEYSRMLFVKILSNKSGTAQHLIEWIPKAESQTNRRLVNFRSDGGGEYTSTLITKYLTERGVDVKTTSVHTPQHNGKAERAIRTIFEVARAMLIHAQLDDVFWGYATMAAVYLLNRRIVYNNNPKKTPYEIWTGEKPNLSHLKVWGCDAFVHRTQDPDKFDKTERRAVKCIFLGYSQEKMHAYIFYNPEDMSVIVRRDACFYEQCFTAGRYPWSYRSNEDDSTASNNAKNKQNSNNNESQGNGGVELVYLQPFDKEVLADARKSQTALDRLLLDIPLQLQNSAPDQTRERRPPTYYGKIDPSDLYAPDLTRAYGIKENQRFAYVNLILEDSGLDNMSLGRVLHLTHDALAFAATAAQKEPKSFKQAMNSRNWQDWKAAADKEMSAIEEQKTYVLVKRSDVPRNTPVITSKWVFKIKYDSQGNISTYKARLVARGFEQREGIDYNETFSPTIKYRSLRLMQALAAALGYCVRQIDIGNAFLYGTLKETIYMEQPEGYSKDPKNYVCKLVKALYGTKQAPREWNATLHTFITKDLGMKSCLHDPCVYVKQSQSKRVILISVYVDDCTLAHSPLDTKEMMVMKGKIENRFKTKDLNESEWLLGMHITRNEKQTAMKIDIERYIERMLSKFNMEETQIYPETTPMEAWSRLSKDQSPKNDTEKVRMESQRNNMKGIDFRAVVGSLLYASLAARPDITYSVSQISMFASNPGLKHWKAAERILRYLKGTKGRALVHQKTVGDIDISTYQPKIEAYSDSDHAGDNDTRRSTTGFIIYVDGNAVSWTSKRQSSVALSSCEAEYMALAETAKEILWLRYLLEEMICHPLSNPAILYCDNQAAINSTKNDMNHGRMKHIDYRFHFIRECIQNGFIEIKWVPTRAQHADIFTKPLPKNKFLEISEMIMKSNAANSK